MNKKFMIVSIIAAITLIIPVSTAGDIDTDDYHQQDLGNYIIETVVEENPYVTVEDDEKIIIDIRLFSNTLYVGGTGPDNYTKIQDAINDASDGDTVFVYDDLAPYYENVVVDKSIRLIGENRDTTIINGNLDGSVIKIFVDKVYIKNFSIQNGSIGLYINGDGNGGSHKHLIKSNRIINNDIGVKFDYSCYDVFTNNIIENNKQGVILGWLSTKIILKNNNITNNEHEGILIEDASSLYINKNNIHNNNPSAFFELETTFYPCEPWRVYLWVLKIEALTIMFSKNYYKPNRVLPFPIDGKLFVWGFFNWQGDFKSNYRIYDLRPVKNPYEITEENTVKNIGKYSNEESSAQQSQQQKGSPQQFTNPLIFWFLERFPMLERLLSLLLL